VSSKQLTTFSDFRYSEHGDFLSTEQYVQYLQAYCTHFKLWPHMRLNTQVLSVTRGADGSHIITYKTNEARFPYEWRCDAVAVCSGLHVTPNIPNIKGMENVPLAFHSSGFKSRKQFGTDKTVMVVGSGETGTDIAYLAATSPTKRVLLCHRDGLHFAPKVCTVALRDVSRFSNAPLSSFLLTIRSEKSGSRVVSNSWEETGP
jgi:dimethylaniline monooxygenase (N-oxide forming)